MFLAAKIDIEDELLKEVIKATGLSNKKEAVHKALQEFLKITRRQKLSNMIGNYEEFDLEFEDLERIRRES